MRMRAASFTVLILIDGICTHAHLYCMYPTEQSIACITYIWVSVARGACHMHMLLVSCWMKRYIRAAVGLNSPVMEIPSGSWPDMLELKNGLLFFY